MPGDRAAGQLEILADLQRMRHPAYVEFEAGTRAITLLLIPLVAQIVGVVPAANGVEVSLRFRTPANPLTVPVPCIPNAQLVGTSAAIFWRGSNGATNTDQAYTQTNIVLATYRLQLKNRSLSAVGPPPYANCP